MSKKILIAICITTVALICLCAVLVSYKENADIKTIQSIGELNNFYYHKDESALKEIVANTLAAPLYIIRGFFSNIGGITGSYNNSITPDYYDDIGTSRKSSGSGITPESITASPTNADSSSSNSMLSSIGENSSKEYSTTNIQVENVDEADITKTDGDYIYSISDDNVIITNASVPEEIKVEATIKSGDGSIPEDLILYNNKLVIIATNSSSNYYKNNSNTMVKIYDITNKSKPNMVKSFELYEPYYTSRCINNELYIISSGTLRLDSSDVERKYKENREEQEIPLNKIKYLKDVTTDKQTIIATMDLNNIDNKIDLNSYLIDISNAYVSENGIYLLDEKYSDNYYNDGILIFHCNTHYVLVELSILYIPFELIHLHIYSLAPHHL